MTVQQNLKVLCSVVCFVAVTVLPWPDVSCSVRGLLDTKLMDVERLGVNSALLRPFGHTQWLMRNRATFENVTQRDRLDAIGRSLLCAQRLLYGSELRWWLVDGALVGAYRHSAMLPHDEDADIMLPRPDFARFVARLERLNVRRVPHFYSAADRATWHRMATKIAYYSDGDSCAVMSRRQDDTLVAEIVDLDSGFYTDVWVGDIVNDSYRWFEFDRWHTLPLDDIFPLQSARLGNLVLPVPVNVKAYLRQTFGDFEHPHSKLMVLALFTRLPSSRQWCFLLIVVSAGSCALGQPVQRNQRFHVLLVGVAALFVLLRADCIGRFASLAALYAVGVLLFHASKPRNVARGVGFCSASMLLLACVLALKTCLVMLVERYEFRNGDKTAYLLDWPFFSVDYRSFWNG
jgi:hypothetical protein